MSKIQIGFHVKGSVKQVIQVLLHDSEMEFRAKQQTGEYLPAYGGSTVITTGHPSVIVAKVLDQQTSDLLISKHGGLKILITHSFTDALTDLYYAIINHADKETLEDPQIIKAMQLAEDIIQRKNVDMTLSGIPAITSNTSSKYASG